MVAVVRRVLGVGLVMAALLCAFWPARGVWVLVLVEQGKEKRGIAKVGEAPRPVEGSQWARLYQMTDALGDRLYLPFDTEPLAGLHQPGGVNVFRFRLPDAGTRLLRAMLQPPFAYRGNADLSWGLNHPHVWLAPWLALAGLMAYLVLPRPKRRENQARYKIFRSQVGPDLLAVILGGVFLVLPLLIIAENARRADPLSGEGGWVALTLVCWFLALIALANSVVAAWYEALCFTRDEIGITKANLRGARHYPFARMIEMVPGVMQAPGWLRRAAWLMVLFNPGLAGPVVLGAQAQAPVVLVPCRDGRTLSVFTKHLVGWDMLEQAMLEAGVGYASPAGNEHAPKNV